MIRKIRVSAMAIVPFLAYFDGTHMTTRFFLSRKMLAIASLATGLIAPSPLAAAPLTEAQISEFLANNDDGIRDEDGDREDWIEKRVAGREKSFQHSKRVDSHHKTTQERKTP